MSTDRQNVSRRQFLTAAAAVGTAAATPGLWAAEAAGPVAFFLVGDTHYLANKERPTEIDEHSAAVTSRLIDTLNALPGTAIHEGAGGGIVRAPQGLIHAGDLIDSGDKTGAVHEKMQRTEWEAFVADYGLSGKEGRLKYPVYEVHGNHDGPQGRGIAIDGIIDRNSRRPGLKQTSANGLHYSWDWGPVHLVNLGIVVGQAKDVAQRRRYNPLDSLDFLAHDLGQQVGDSGRPVVITHHIDVVRYTGPCDVAEPTNASKEWHPCDVRAYYEAIQKYNIVAILYGHTHTRNIALWDGASGKAQQGLSLFNVDNSGHFGGANQALLYFEIADREVLVREYATKDAWQTGSWTAQVWKRPVRA